MLTATVERLAGQSIPSADEIISLASFQTPHEGSDDQHQDELKVLLPRSVVIILLPGFLKRCQRSSRTTGLPHFSRPYGPNKTRLSERSTDGHCGGA
jgi:hypothetical protein